MKRSSKAVALKGLPESTWARLERRAKFTRRSLSSVAVEAVRRGLGEAVDSDNVRAEQVISDIHRRWSRGKGKTNFDPAKAIREDRENR